MILPILAFLINMNNPLEIVVPLISESKGGYWHGTGFLIDETTVLTADHVLSHKGTTTTALCGNKKIKTIKITQFGDDERDLAVIKLEEPCKNKILKLAPKSPQYGDRIFAIGCPEDLELCGMVTSGVVSLYMKHNDVLRMFSDIKIWFGNSGGPVLNEKGELVGVVIEIKSVSKIKGHSLENSLIAQNYAIITPISEIIDFLMEYEVFKESEK